MKHPECKFCKILHEQKDKIIFHNEHIAVVFGRLHHKGHLVVLPRVHEEHFLKLHETTLNSFFNDTVKIMKALDKAIKPDIINLEYLDNWDHHIHWNVYPRFKSDPDWGNPPTIPGKDDTFEEKKMTDKEMKIFMDGLERYRKEMW